MCGFNFCRIPSWALAPCTSKHTTEKRGHTETNNWNHIDTILSSLAIQCLISSYTPYCLHDMNKIVMSLT